MEGRRRNKCRALDPKKRVIEKRWREESIGKKKLEMEKKKKWWVSREDNWKMEEKRTREAKWGCERD